MLIICGLCSIIYLWVCFPGFQYVCLAAFILQILVAILCFCEWVLTISVEQVVLLPYVLLIILLLQVLVGHPDYEITGGSITYKGQDLLEMEPEERAVAGMFMSFQSPVEIPGVSNIDFLNMAYNARRRKLGQPELGPIEVVVCRCDISLLSFIWSRFCVSCLHVFL